MARHPFFPVGPARSPFQPRTAARSDPPPRPSAHLPVNADPQVSRCSSLQRDAPLRPTARRVRPASPTPWVARASLPSPLAWAHASVVDPVAQRPRVTVATVSLPARGHLSSPSFLLRRSPPAPLLAPLNPAHPASARGPTLRPWPARQPARSL